MDNNYSTRLKHFGIKGFIYSDGKREYSDTIIDISNSTAILAKNGAGKTVTINAFIRGLKPYGYIENSFDVPYLYQYSKRFARYYTFEKKEDGVKSHFLYIVLTQLKDKEGSEQQSIKTSYIMAKSRIKPFDLSNPAFDMYSIEQKDGKEVRKLLSADAFKKNVVEYLSTLNGVEITRKFKDYESQSKLEKELFEHCEFSARDAIAATIKLGLKEGNLSSFFENTNERNIRKSIVEHAARGSLTHANTEENENGYISIDASLLTEDNFKDEILKLSEIVEKEKKKQDSLDNLLKASEILSDSIELVTQAQEIKKEQDKIEEEISATVSNLQNKIEIITKENEDIKKEISEKDAIIFHNEYLKISEECQSIEEKLELLKLEFEQAENDAKNAEIIYDKQIAKKDYLEYEKVKKEIAELNYSLQNIEQNNECSHGDVVKTYILQKLNESNEKLDIIKAEKKEIQDQINSYNKAIEEVDNNLFVLNENNTKFVSNLNKTEYEIRLELNKINEISKQALNKECSLDIADVIETSFFSGSKYNPQNVLSVINKAIFISKSEKDKFVSEIEECKKKNINIDDKISVCKGESQTLLAEKIRIDRQIENSNKVLNLTTDKNKYSIELLEAEIRKIEAEKFKLQRQEENCNNKIHRFKNRIHVVEPPIEFIDELRDNLLNDFTIGSDKLKDGNNTSIINDHIYGYSIIVKAEEDKQTAISISKKHHLPSIIPIYTEEETYSVLSNKNLLYNIDENLLDESFINTKIAECNEELLKIHQKLENKNIELASNQELLVLYKDDYFSYKSHEELLEDKHSIEKNIFYIQNEIEELKNSQIANKDSITKITVKIKDIEQTIVRLEELSNVVVSNLHNMFTKYFSIEDKIEESKKQKDELLKQKDKLKLLIEENTIEFSYKNDSLSSLEKEQDNFNKIMENLSSYNILNRIITDVEYKIAYNEFLSVNQEYQSKKTFLENKLIEAQSKLDEINKGWNPTEDKFGLYLISELLEFNSNLSISKLREERDKLNQEKDDCRKAYEDVDKKLVQKAEHVRTTYEQEYFKEYVNIFECNNKISFATNEKNILNAKYNTNKTELNIAENNYKRINDLIGSTIKLQINIANTSLNLSIEDCLARKSKYLKLRNTEDDIFINLNENSLKIREVLNNVETSTNIGKIISHFEDIIMVRDYSRFENVIIVFQRGIFNLKTDAESINIDSQIAHSKSNIIRSLYAFFNHFCESLNKGLKKSPKYGNQTVLSLKNLPTFDPNLQTVYYKVFTSELNYILDNLIYKNGKEKLEWLDKYSTEYKSLYVSILEKSLESELMESNLLKEIKVSIYLKQTTGRDSKYDWNAAKNAGSGAMTVLAALQVFITLLLIEKGYHSKLENNSSMEYCTTIYMDNPFATVSTQLYVDHMFELFRQYNMQVVMYCPPTMIDKLQYFDNAYLFEVEKAENSNKERSIYTPIDMETGTIIDEVAQISFCNAVTSEEEFDQDTMQLTFM